MFNGFELSEITKYLCYQDFINFRKVSKSIYERTKNEYILRKCIATLSLNKIKKCWKKYKNKKYSIKWADNIGHHLFGGANINYDRLGSYWSAVYHRHSYFSMESISMESISPQLSFNNDIIKPSKKQNKLKKLDYKQFKK